MSVITITRQYGSKGSEVGARIADALGYRLLDKEIASELANRAQITEAEALMQEEKGASPLSYFFQKYFCAPHIVQSANTLDDLHLAPLQDLQAEFDTTYFDEDQCAKHTRDLILDEAEKDNVVIVGRGAATLLADFPQTLHLCVFAPQTYRIRTLMMRYGISTEEAFQKLQRVDTERMRFVKRHYNGSLDDSAQYDLLINSGKMDLDTITQTILETVQNKFGYKSWPQAIGLSS